MRYKRHCVRLSFFAAETDEDDFTDPAKKEKIERLYRGFLILRPTEPQIIGRSLISPKALKHRDFLACSTTVSTTVNSIKVCVEGFPHSSQDAETIKCAETTIWALMEYYGSKYPEYKPVLPSTIIKQLNSLSYERQIPSNGLNIMQMSFALKEFGFAPRIYAKEVYKDEFDKLLRIYIESGIPIVLGLEGGSIGHAVLCVGRNTITDKQIEALSESIKVSEDLSIYCWESLSPSCILIDDNHPVYQQASLNKPTSYYTEGHPDWKKCEIAHFLVPLYPKIYLEAFRAKQYVIQFLASSLLPIDNSELLVRLYLTSSRSFKNHVALSAELQDNVRNMILETSMPKFIWVAELSTKHDIKSKKANGLLIIDATEANLNYNYPLLFAMYKHHVLTPDFESNTLEKKVVALSPFLIYEQNLKPA
ncbi:MAG: hypothetical protein V4616_05970 [Bacteroidota bacterium]